MTPTRRTFLAGTALLGAGCLGGPESGEGTEHDPDTESTPTPTDDARQTPHGSEYTLDLEPVDRATLDERFDVARAADQPSQIREVIAAAIEDRYETDAVERSVALFLAAHAYVRSDGQYYALEASVPQKLLTVEDVPDGDVNPDAVATAEAVRRNGTVAEVVGDAIAEGEVRRPAFPDALHELLEQYEYVTLERSVEDGEVYAWELATADADGPPYWIDAGQVDAAAVFGDAVVDYESLSDEAQSEVAAAIADGTQYYDDPPTVRDEGAIKYVRHDGRIYDVRISVGG